MADPIAELRKRLNDPLAVMLDEIRTLGFDDIPGLEEHGVEHMTWWRRNLEAIRMLQEAERLNDPRRVDVLLAEIETLDHEALPENFFYRLCVLARETKNRTPHKGALAERDETIRRAWNVLRSDEANQLRIDAGEHPHGYDSALIFLSEKTGYTKGTIRGVVDAKLPHQMKSKPDDFARLTQKRFTLRNTRKS